MPREKNGAVVVSAGLYLQEEEEEVAWGMAAPLECYALVWQQPVQLASVGRRDSVVSSLAGRGGALSCPADECE